MNTKAVPRTKSGTLAPSAPTSLPATRAPRRAPVSAEAMPSGTPIPIAMIPDMAASCRVVGARRPISAATEAWVTIDRPKSPMRAWPSHFTYCTTIG